MHEHGGNNLKH